jgi:hypothetical protein
MRICTVVPHPRPFGGLLNRRTGRARSERS